MASSAVARETLLALRRKIASIEGTLPERLEAPGPANAPGNAPANALAGLPDAAARARLRTGAGRLDALLGGGLVRAALTEVHGGQTRDAGAVAGFAMALTGLLLERAENQRAENAAPVLWVGTAEIFREAGFPHAAGLGAPFGIAPERLLLCEAPKLADALWVAEEAAALTTLSAVVLEMRGNCGRLDLTATRRLHRRAQAAGRPVLLLRQAAQAEPTAAPVRLLVSPAPAAARNTLAGPLAGSIGQLAFTVAVDKCPAALPGRFILEWNPDEHQFRERSAAQGRTEDPVAVVSLSGHGKGAAAAPGKVVAFPALAARASGSQPPGEQRPPYRRAGREG
ncbi:protein ImuA [Aquamicrobium terrae]